MSRSLKSYEQRPIVREDRRRPLSPRALVTPPTDLRFLLLQVRNPDDPMREHEICCFERCFGLTRGQVAVFDLLGGAPSPARLDSVDVVLLGGSGDYSVARGGPWLPAALEAMVGLYETSKPTFASCWGFQAMARAMGGEVITDHARAEVGVTWMHLTPAGMDDPVFGPLSMSFQALAGHEDVVTRLPSDAVCLVSSELVENQAFCFPGKPIYCTQFHPELTRHDMVLRLEAYPRYVEHMTGTSIEDFFNHLRESPELTPLLPRFVELVQSGQL